MLPVSHRRLIFALGIVLSVHLCLLMIPIAVETNKPNKKSSTLKLTLKRAVSVPPTPTEILTDPAQIKPTEEAITPTEIEPQKSTTEVASNLATEKGGAGTQNKPFDRVSIINSVVSIIQEGAAKPAPRAFGLAQWLPKATPDHRRKSEAPLLISASASNQTGGNAAGQSTDLVRGPNGKTACWQQRGIPGETQQWYRVPLALCGHLNKP